MKGALAGAGTYTKALARTSKRPLLAWPLILFVVAIATSYSIADFYRASSARAGYSIAMEVAPIVTAISGSGTGLDSLGGIMANELALIVFTGVSIGAVMLAVGRTRKEEDLGRTEVLTAKPVGRLAPLAAGVIVVLASFLLFSVLVVTSLVAFDVPLIGPETGTATAASGGALTYGVLVFGYAALFAGIGFLGAELFDSARGATTFGIALFFAFYLVRIFVNSSDFEAWWTTPVGWFDAAEPFANTNWLPIGMFYIGAAALMGAAGIMRRRRDISTGVFSGGAGKSRAPGWLGTPTGLAWRLTRSTFAAWVLVSLVFGALFGYLLDQWVEVMELNLESMEAFGFTASTDSISQMVGIIAALFGGAMGVSAVGSFAREEQSTRLAFLLSKPLTRTRMWTSWIALALILGVVVAILAVASYGVAGDLSGEINALATMQTMAVYLVPVLFLTAVAAAGVGLRPGGIWIGWLVYGIAAVFSFLGEILQLPEWLLNLGPINGIGEVPMEDVSWLAIGIELGLSGLLVAVAVWAFNRREVVGS